MSKSLSLKEIVVMAMIAALLGVVFTVIDSVYQPISALLGPLGGTFIYGIYLISALLSMYIMRKPGAGLVGSLFTGLINLLMGSPYGIHIIVASTLQGVGVEAAMALSGYKKYNFLQMSIGAVLAMIFVTIRDYFIFGFASYENLVPVMLLVRVISSIIFGAGLTIAIGKGLKSTGALNGFKIAARSDS
ncbi:ECF transporter S component [Tissierella sp. MB52-C2]|uniref:ECF transporter S component n=1 Tax=Tissierella sp. MB52-C2 TaxID=3070999 RepID=UPI00280C19D0|nr:ECF transporter S component [Tissierella sp. MB52-C2]WMM25162.1 ECF transporter S component [Tissierella sp. MB52-C2]